VAASDEGREGSDRRHRVTYRPSVSHFSIQISNIEFELRFFLMRVMASHSVFNSYVTK